MLSPEFKEAVRSRNVLRTRIMIKDAFVTDPSCALVDEMLQYAKNNGLKLMEPYDGGDMKKFSSEWDQAALNDELVKLVDNFSEDRIQNLRLMVKKVIGVPRNEISDEQRKEKRRDALQKMSAAGEEVKKVIDHVTVHPSLQNKVATAGKGIKKVPNGYKWSLKDVANMEKAAKDILNAVKQYKDNLPTKR